MHFSIRGSFARILISFYCVKTPKDSWPRLQKYFLNVKAVFDVRYSFEWLIRLNFN